MLLMVALGLVPTLAAPKPAGRWAGPAGQLVTSAEVNLAQAMAAKMIT